MLSSQLAWWQKEIVYQVYPRSFQDADGDGVGDLPGLIDRLDYLAALGVGAVWVSPFYPSPMADFGYDVSDSGLSHQNTYNRFLPTGSLRPPPDLPRKRGRDG